MPITYFMQAPQEGDNGSFRPNLHSVWDTEDHSAPDEHRGLADAQALANRAAGSSLPATVAPLTPTTTRIRSWAGGSNAVARMVTYGRLPVNPPMEPASAAMIASCTDNNQVSQRMAQLHGNDRRLVRAGERAGDSESAAAGRASVWRRC